MGTTPGGELGGTWAAPTVDATHSGSAHAARSTQAAIEAETDEATYVSPNRVRNSPGVIKAYLKIDTAGLLVANSYNITSVTDTGVGDRTIVFNTDFSNANYAAVATNTDNIASGEQHPRFLSPAVGTIRLVMTKTVSTFDLVDVASDQMFAGDQ